MPRITSLPPPTTARRSQSTMTNCVNSCNRVVVSSSSSSSHYSFSLLTKVSSSLSKRCLVLMCISTLLLSLFNASIAVATVGENNAEFKHSVAAVRQQHNQPPPPTPSTSPTSAQQPHEREASLLLCPQGKKKKTNTPKNLFRSFSISPSLSLVRFTSKSQSLSLSCIGSCKRSQIAYLSLPLHHHVSHL